MQMVQAERQVFLVAWYYWMHYNADLTHACSGASGSKKHIIAQYIKVQAACLKMTKSFYVLRKNEDNLSYCNSDWWCMCKGHIFRDGVQDFK